MPKQSTTCPYCGSSNVLIAYHSPTYISHKCGACENEWNEYITIAIKASENDAVSHPKHYANGMTTEVECIMFTRWMSFDLGNAFKYIWRAGHKDNFIQELDKALWYLEDATEHDIKEQHFELINFLPKSSLEGWKYTVLRAILQGNFDMARSEIQTAKVAHTDSVSSDRN